MHGFNSRFAEWSRPPEPLPAGSGIVVQPPERRPDVRLYRLGYRAGISNRAQTLDTVNEERSHATLNKMLDPEILM